MERPAAASPGALTPVLAVNYLHANFVSLSVGLYNDIIDTV